MITRPTVLILGAGASADRGFPLGLKFKENASATLSRSRDAATQHMLGELGYDTKLQKEFGRELMDSPYMSVDAFLERHDEFLEVGKAVIAATLIPVEKEAFLRLTSGPGERWYDFLWQRMTERAGQHISDNKLSVVTFNYDRSFEQYLWRGLVHGNNLTEEKAREELRAIPIIHLHGKLGRFPYLDDGEGRFYRPDLSPQAIQEAAQNIKIVHEVQPGDEFAVARMQLAKAQIIIFLGFGYLQDNMERLGCIPEADNRQTWYGSAMGLGPGQTDNLKTTFNGKIRFAGRDDDCLETLKQFPVLF